MRVRFTIDRVILDGLELSPFERARLLADLEVALGESLRSSATHNLQGPAPLPSGRHVRSERADLVADRSGRATLGTRLGRTLVDRTWTSGGDVPRGRR
jgi:hypothetical protein